MERRPIASRNTRWANSIAKALASTGITPNTISVWGMVFATAAGGAFYLTKERPDQSVLFWIIGAACIQMRLLANLFDGMVAQLQDSSSPVGEIYNEVPDRVSDFLIITGFGAALGSEPVLGLLASVLAIFVAYIRAQLGVSGVPQLFTGPMAKAQRMALLTIAALLAAFLPQYPIAKWTLWIVIIGCIITAFRRLTLGGKHLRREPSSEPEE